MNTVWYGFKMKENGIGEMKDIEEWNEWKNENKLKQHMWKRNGHDKMRKNVKSDKKKNLSFLQEAYSNNVNLCTCLSLSRLNVR